MAGRTLKDMMATKDVKVGHFVVEFLTPGLGHILKAAGCGLVLLDMEHWGFGMDAMRQALRYMEAAGLPAFVRPPSKQYHDVARLLDIGAQGRLGGLALGPRVPSGGVLQAGAASPPRYKCG